MFVSRVKDKLKRMYGQLAVSVKLTRLRSGNKLHIMNSEETLDMICKRRLSITRFGDGEFNILFNQRGVNFQSGSADLSLKLREVLLSDDPKLLVCIPYAVNSVQGLNEHAKNFYNNWSLDNYELLSSMLIAKNGKSHVYGDANITRPYKDWKNPAHAKKIFDGMKRLWKDQDLLIVEGCQTRLGIGNDLFRGARSIKRILAPAENAFDCYDEILHTVLKWYNGELIMLALGPTATVLAYDLAKRGMQALDIGHVDIEYEWFLRGSTSKIAIPGKYTNEAADGNKVADCEDPLYLSQIIAKVGLL